MFFKSKKNQNLATKGEHSSVFSRLKSRLQRTRSELIGRVGQLLGKPVNADFMDELETLLLAADVGLRATDDILAAVRNDLSDHDMADSQRIFTVLYEQMQAILSPCMQPLNLDRSPSPFVILTVGVNGVGKTTSIGKLAHYFKTQGHSVMLAAGDTFRAAATEQLQSWGDRNDVPVIAQHHGADSASVIFDALAAAKARKIDILIADTAGRLHTQQNLMGELKKVARVLAKLDEQAPHEVLMVLDASIGQNTLNQVREFHQHIGISGLLLTKLDGTAKGGILFTLASELNIPIRFLGTGESLEDLQPFVVSEFLNALFDPFTPTPPSTEE